MSKQEATGDGSVFEELQSSWDHALRRSLTGSRALALGWFERDGRVAWANEGMRSLLGLAGPDGPPPAAFVNPSFEKLWQGESNDGGPVFEGLMTMGDGFLKSHTVRATVYRQPDRILVVAEHDVEELEELNGKLVDLNKEVNRLQRELLHDKSALERAFAELKETQAMLVQSEKMSSLGQLVAGVAHEINNPVAFVHSNIHSLGSTVSDLKQAYEELEAVAGRDEAAPSRVAATQELREEHDVDFLLEDLQDMRQSCLDGLVRVKHIVENLRTFSRLDEAECKDADLAENISSTLELAAPELRKRAVEVVVDLPELEPIRCHVSELNQVFLNLVVNAAQAMEGGGTLTITGRQEAGEVHLAFRDQGCGMPPEVVARAFDPFFTTKPVGSGTGLGLSIAYKIITDHHGGRIEVDSTPGEGTTFQLTLPRAPTDETPEGAP